jgi:4-methyl-5(b-hydroxyethyl)-thiazole monophosphate biosynthesis
MRVPSACDRKELAAKGRSNITLMADVDLDSIAARDFDCVFCPGGPGTKLLREDQRVIDIVKRHAAANKKVVAICAAPTVLKVAVRNWSVCVCVCVCV